MRTAASINEHQHLSPNSSYTRTHRVWAIFNNIFFPKSSEILRKPYKMKWIEQPTNQPYKQYHYVYRTLLFCLCWYTVFLFCFWWGKLTKWMWILFIFFIPFLSCTLSLTLYQVIYYLFYHRSYQSVALFFLHIFIQRIAQSSVYIC